MNKHDLAKRISDLLIIKQDDNSYHLFGQYVITRDKNNFFSITNQYDPDIEGLCFAELKHAVTWCVFHKNRKIKDLPKIAELDETLSGLQAMIDILKRKTERASTEDKPIYLAKLTEDKRKKQAAQKAMNFYIDTSKYWQSKVFKEYQTY